MYWKSVTKFFEDYWRVVEWENNTQQKKKEQEARPTKSYNTLYQIHSHGKPRKRFVSIVNYNGWHFHISRIRRIGFVGTHRMCALHYFVFSFKTSFWNLCDWLTNCVSCICCLFHTTRVSALLCLVLSFAFYLGALNAVRQKFFLFLLGIGVQDWRLTEIVSTWFCSLFFFIFCLLHLLCSTECLCNI